MREILPSPARAGGTVPAQLTVECWIVAAPAQSRGHSPAVGLGQRPYDGAMLQPRPRQGWLAPRQGHLVVGSLVVAVAAMAIWAILWRGSPATVIGLRSEGLALEWRVGDDGTAQASVVPVPTGAAPTFLPGSRVIDPGAAAPSSLRAGAARASQEQRAWLAVGTLPGASGDFADMAEAALLDLYLASHGPDGSVHAPWAAPTGAWRYVWPRDASFVAVALARTGHVDDAIDVLAFLQNVQHEDGSFQARYHRDGSTPDDRGVQSDAAGWVLWALAEVVDEAGAEQAAEVLVRLASLIERTAGWALELTASPHRLPPPSMDYWERRERALTLGTAAPILAGLEALARLRAVSGDEDGAAHAQERASEVRAAVERAFAPVGWSRHVFGGARDAATAFALPPFQPSPLEGAVEAWAASAAGMARPGGGLAPGEAWGEPLYSWTPETALYALAAASLGRDDEATAWLAWLDAHRTLTGSIPEKVSAEGEPAQVAPLVWSSALVLLTLAELDAR